AGSLAYIYSNVWVLPIDMGMIMRKMNSQEHSCFILSHTHTHPHTHTPTHTHTSPLFKRPHKHRCHLPAAGTFWCHFFLSIMLQRGHPQTPVSKINSSP